MKMLDLDVGDAKKMDVVTEEEALEFLEAGVAIICQVRPREFLELRKESDLQQCEKLKNEGIYDSLNLFLEN